MITDSFKNTSKDAFKRELFMTKEEEAAFFAKGKKITKCPTVHLDTSLIKRGQYQKIKYEQDLKYGRPDY